MKVKLDETNTSVIACEMIEDEVKEAMKRSGVHYPVQWVERGYHNIPEKLHAILQERIARAEGSFLEKEQKCAGAGQSSAAKDRSYILLAFGLCGKSVAGLSSSGANLVIPRFDDCINLMLCPKIREKRAYMKAGVSYLTGGWTRDSGSALHLYEDCIAKYGERRGKRAFHLLFDAYTTAALIDNGCYDKEPVERYAREMATLLGLEVREVPGGIHGLTKLFSGDFDEDILVYPPGVPIREEDFAFRGEKEGTFIGKGV